jgi:hypothetical protein
MPRGRPARTGAALAAALAAALVAWPSPPQADPDGWTVTGALSGRLGLLSNPRFASGANTLAAQLGTSLSLSAVKQSATSSLGFTGAIAPVFIKGGGNDVLGTLAPSLGLSFTDAASSRTTLSGSLTTAFTSTAFLDPLFTDLNGDGIIDPGELTFVTGSAVQFRASGNLGLSWTATSRDSLSLRLTGRRLDYFNGSTSLIPNSSLSLGGGWTRALTPRLSAQFGVNLGWFDSEGSTTVTNPVAASTSLSLDTSAGLTYAVNSRLTVSGNLGIAFARTERDFLAGSGLPGTSNFNIGATGGLGLSYATAETNVTLSLSQGFQPSSFGSLQNTTALSLGLSHQINALSAIGLNTAFQLQQAVGVTNPGTLTAFRVSPFYSYTLDANTALRLSYNLDIGNQAGTQNTVSHAVFLSLTRNFTLLN